MDIDNGDSKYMAYIKVRNITGWHIFCVSLKSLTKSICFCAP